MQNLFTSIDEIREYITVDISSDYRTISPYVTQAQKYTTEIIGKQLHGLLIDVVHNNNDTERLKELLKIVRLPLARFAYMLAISELNVNVSERGFTIAVDNNLEPASKWRIDEFRTSISDSAYDGLEILIEYLEDNTTVFPEWKLSKSFSFQNQFFVNNAKELNETVFIEIKRLDFLNLKQFIFQVEQSIVKPVISVELFNEIKTQILNQNISETNDYILKNYIKAAVCYHAIDKKTPNENYRLEGTRLLEQLRIYLNNNASSYPLYLNSDCYSEPATALSFSVNNEQNGFIVL